MKLVIDTNICCDYAEGVPETVDVIAAYGEYIFLPSIVIGELMYGFMKGSKREYNERKLMQFINRLKVETIFIDDDVARKYVTIYISLVDKELKIPINDVWIAASCMEIGGILLTRDKHFKLIDQIDSIIL